MPTVYIIFYSLYHHVYTLAKSVKAGLEKEGVDVKLFQVPETLPGNILEKLQAPEKPDVQVITVEQLAEADGFLFGLPTRFGMLPAQVKAFLDATGAQWQAGELAGKFVGTFFSTSSQHGGQETTALTTFPVFAHHGMNFVPLGVVDLPPSDPTEVVGGSAYGAGTITNADGSRQPSVRELEIAVVQGGNFGRILNTFHKGKMTQNSEERNELDVPTPIKATKPTKADNALDKKKKVKTGSKISRCLCM